MSNKDRGELRDKKLDSEIYDLMCKIVSDFKELDPSDAAMVVEAWSELIHRYSHQREREAIRRIYENSLYGEDKTAKDVQERLAGYFVQSKLVGNINGINIETDDRLEDGEYYVKQSQEREQRYLRKLGAR